MGLLRFFHSGLRHQKENASAMALLRKKTGYAFSNIRKALELNGNDLEKAERWLAEQAKALGWSKAAKLQDRKAVEGLVGVAVQNKKVAMVEVNCESDFVSRNEKFKSLVELVARTCLQQPVLAPGLDTHKKIVSVTTHKFASLNHQLPSWCPCNSWYLRNYKQFSSSNGSLQLILSYSIPHVKVEFNTEEIGKLKAGSSSLADHMALLTGSVGENTALRRAFCYETSRDDVRIAVAVHPPQNNSQILLGKYGSFISFVINSEDSFDENFLPIASNICTHIIGMNPHKIGEFGKDEPSENGDDETVLIHQDFVLNESLTVGQLLTDTGMTILDFKRFQCGESMENEKSTESNSEQQLNQTTA